MAYRGRGVTQRRRTSGIDKLARKQRRATQHHRQRYQHRRHSRTGTLLALTEAACTGGRWEIADEDDTVAPGRANEVSRVNAGHTSVRAAASVVFNCGVV